MNGDNQLSTFYTNAITIVEQGKGYALASVNQAILSTYWHLGRHIVEEEQSGKHRASYGTELIKSLADVLTPRYGNSYNEKNLRYFRQFYLCFNDMEIWYARVPNLTWTHIRHILKVNNDKARQWYLNEAASQMWSTRTLERNINTQYYERLLSSQVESTPNTTVIAAPMAKRLDFVKNPIVAEFLGLQPSAAFYESDLEKAIIGNLQQFLMELGKGYAFVARQQHIRTDENDYFIDLVFYNYILKCFVLIDLKTDKISFQDVGQMEMYLRLYDTLKKQPDDNPTIGIVLCAETDGDVARFSTLAENPQMYAAKYKLYMPTEEDLSREIERQKEIFRLQQESRSKQITASE